MPAKHRKGFRTKSGAIKLQVLLRPAEYRALVKCAKESNQSLSAVARRYLAHWLGYPSGIPAVTGGKYQPRGFAR